MQIQDETDSTTKTIVAVVVTMILVTLLLIVNPFVIVGAGERGIVLNWGAVSNSVLGEGIHWRIPVQQSVKMMNVRTAKTEVEAVAYSKDTQTVDSQVAVNYHLEADRANLIYQTIGDNSKVETNILLPAIQEVFKGVVAKYSASELLEKREEVSSSIKDNLAARLQDKNVVVESINIINFDFSDVYEAAVEAKQKAQQDALKAQNDLERVKMEAEQRVTQAKAEAEAIKIQAEAITQQGGEDYVQLKAIEKWNGILPNQMIPGGTVPFINLTK